MTNRGMKIKLFLLAILLAGGYVFFFRDNTVNKLGDPVQNPAPQQDSLEEKPKKGVLKTFTGAQFRDLYNSLAYPNTEQISDKTPITGNSALDARIRFMAESKGYTLRSAPVADTFREVQKGMRLQERAAEAWLNMQTAAKKDGIIMNLGDAYRSADEQKAIFLSRFTARNGDAHQINSGLYDQQIANTLKMTAVPGYSRHHTGYTIDIECQNNPAAQFIKTNCFQWLSTNNYENAKKFGWIPSYPEATGLQGPEPESWEYVWVGVDTLAE